MTNKKTILIVEDENSLGGVLKDALEEAGFETVIAHDGMEGLQSLEGHNIDLILLDILMPVMDGLAMLQKLREEVGNHEVKVILLTNLSDSEKFEEAKKFKIDGYIVKNDVDLAQIVQKVKAILN